MATSDVIDSINASKANRQRAIDTGNNEDNYFNSQLGYYGNNEDTYRGQADTAFQDLHQTPGYTADQAEAIKGDPNAAFKFYHPEAISGDVDASAAGVNQSVGDYTGGLTGAAHDAGGAVTGAAGKLGSDVTSAAGQYGTDLTSTAKDLGAGLNKPTDDEGQWQGGVYQYQRGEGDQAYGGLDKGLNAAVDPNKLSLSDKFAGDYALSDKQGQNIRDVAANTVKGQYEREQSQLAQQAAASGNSSPAQIAALQMQLGRQGAIDAGDAASAAELNVNNTAAARQQQLEAMRLGTQQDISTRQTANAGTLYGAQTGQANTLAANELGGIRDLTAARQGAASQAANLGYSAAQTGGAAKVAAAQTAGQAATDAAKVAGDYSVGAADKTGQAAIDAAKYTGAQRIASDTGQQQTGQGLASAADTAASQRATTVANQDLSGQQQYRGYLTGEQGSAQQGKETTSGQQIQSQGTQGGLANQATQTAGNIAIGQQQVDKAPGEGERIGLNLADATIGGAAKVASAQARGTVATHPTSVIVGERGPEMIVPLHPRNRYRMAA